MSRENFAFNEGAEERAESPLILDPFGDVEEGVYTQEINDALAANPGIIDAIKEAERGGEEFPL